MKAVGAKNGVPIPQAGSVAAQALAKIAEIYHLEGLLKDLSPEERLCRRQKEVAPLGEAYFTWVKEQNLLQIGSKKTCDGLAYSLNQEKQLKMFLRDGEIPIDISARERAIRPFTVGRKNWMISRRCFLRHAAYSCGFLIAPKYPDLTPKMYPKDILA